jgi:hypothetical protein
MASLGCGFLEQRICSCTPVSAYPMVWIFHSPRLHSGDEELQLHPHHLTLLSLTLLLASALFHGFLSHFCIAWRAFILCLTISRRPFTVLCW